MQAGSFLYDLRMRAPENSCGIDMSDVVVLQQPAKSVVMTQATSEPKLRLSKLKA